MTKQILLEIRPSFNCIVCSIEKKVVVFPITLKQMKKKKIGKITFDRNTSTFQQALIFKDRFTGFGENQFFPGALFDVQTIQFMTTSVSYFYFSSPNEIKANSRNQYL